MICIYCGYEGDFEDVCPHCRAEVPKEQKETKEKEVKKNGN